MFDQYDLFCFDFDGLLVDTEPLHHLAYMEMFEREGAPLKLGFAQYCSLAHSPDRNKLASYLFDRYPSINKDWQALRQKKISIYTEMLHTHAPTLLPGVAEFIQMLHDERKQMCVVTNSSRVDADLIKCHHKVLQQIVKWYTVEQVPRSKPHPDGYLYALQQFNCPPEKAVGFEDTMRGVEALKGAGIKPVLISHVDHDGLQKGPEIENLESFNELLPI